MFFVSTNLSIPYLVHKSKNRKNSYIRNNYVGNYNAMTLEIRTKDNLVRKILGEISKGFFVTVEI